MTPHPVRVCAVGAVLLALAVAPACGRDGQPDVSSAPPAAESRVPTATPTTAAAPPVAPVGDMPGIAALVNDDIAAHRLPGAVVQIGHGGEVVFRQAYGERKLPDEPGLDGAPAPAEPMTVNTIFDLASLSKSVATTTAIMQLHEQGRLQIDDPVQDYLPEFNPSGDPQRAQVTLRMLLTHASGLGGDLSHQGDWGLTAPDKAEGIRLALASSFEFPPGQGFHYSDINFIILGAILEKLTGQTLDDYIQDNVFAPLGMTDTRYYPAAKACGPHQIIGNAIVFDPHAPAPADCPADSWSTDVLPRIAPTARDEDTPGVNPDIDRSLRSTVHDPTARRMGGVAGSAGVFSTVHDLGVFAQALLDRLAGRPSPFPLQQATLEMATTPQQPGHNDRQVPAANRANAAAGTPHYPAIAGQDLRGFGWDIDTEQSRPRGTVFPVGSFGHTGFTGVTLWMDPSSDSYVVVLANVIHQRGGPPITRLSGEIATTAGRVLGLHGN